MFLLRLLVGSLLLLGGLGSGFSIGLGFRSGGFFGLGLSLSGSLRFSLKVGIGSGLGLSLSLKFGFLLGHHLLLGLFVGVFLRLDGFLLESDLLQVHGLLGFHLLLDLQHLQLGFSLSSGQLVLSLQSGEVGLRGSLLSGSGFRFLDCLSGKEFLLHSLSFEFLSRFFLLESFEFPGSGDSQSLLVLPLLLGFGNLLLKLFVLHDFGLSLLLLVGELVKKGLLLSFLLFLKGSQSFALGTRLRQGLAWMLRGFKGHSLLVGFLSGFLQGKLHGSEFLGLGGTVWLFNGVDGDDESFAAPDVHFLTNLDMVGVSGASVRNLFLQVLNFLIGGGNFIGSLLGLLLSQLDFLLGVLGL